MEKVVGNKTKSCSEMLLYLHFFSDTLKAAADNNLYRDELDGFITHMKNQKGTALVEWVQKIQENLNLLKPSLESFVLAILSIPWADQERPVVTAYKHFLTNLISAQSYYTKPVVKMLLTSMLGIKELKVNNIMNSFEKCRMW